MYFPWAVQRAWKALTRSKTGRQKENFTAVPQKGLVKNCTNFQICFLRYTSVSKTTFHQICDIVPHFCLGEGRISDTDLNLT